MPSEVIKVDFNKATNPNNRKFFNLLDRVKLDDLLRQLKEAETEKEADKILYKFMRG